MGLTPLIPMQTDQSNPSGRDVYFAADDKEFQEAIRDAKKEFVVGNWAEARAQIFRAHQIRTTATTLKVLGVCEYRMGNYVQALQYLREALDNPINPPTGESREEVISFIARTKANVGTLQVDLIPPDVTLHVDDNKTDIGPGGTVSLSLGHRSLVFRRPGYKDHKQTVDIAGGRTKTITIQWEQIPNTVPILAAASFDDKSVTEQPAVVPQKNEDRYQLRVAGVLGFANAVDSSITVTQVGSPAMTFDETGNPGLMYGISAGLDVPWQEYITLGGRAKLTFWKSNIDGNTLVAQEGTNTLIELGVTPRVRYTFNDMEIYFAPVLALAMNQAGAVETMPAVTTTVDPGFGVSYQLAVGLQFFIDGLGGYLEAGWGQRRFSMDITHTPDSGAPATKVEQSLVLDSAFIQVGVLLYL